MGPHDRRGVALLGQRRGERQRLGVEGRGGPEAALEARELLVQDVRLAARVREDHRGRGVLLDLLDWWVGWEILVVLRWCWEEAGHLQYGGCPTCEQAALMIRLRGGSRGTLQRVDDVSVAVSGAW